MKKLTDNWLTEGLIDFEYKKYILLAYLQNVKDDFEHRKLYPVFSELIFHYKNLLKIRNNKKLLFENFPKQISHADFQKLQLTYRTIVEDDSLMKEIEDIVFFALPRLKSLLEDGREIYDWVEEHIEVSQVGIAPLYPEEGYLFVNEYNVSETHIFRYQVSVFESAEEKYRGINTSYLESVRKGVGETLENLKISLARQFQFLPNPAAFLIVSRLKCPLQETLMPIAKRAVVKFIYANAA